MVNPRPKMRRETKEDMEKEQEAKAMSEGNLRQQSPPIFGTQLAFAVRTIKRAIKEIAKGESKS